jgi:hypothetical protein
LRRIMLLGKDWRVLSRAVSPRRPVFMEMGYWGLELGDMIAPRPMYVSSSHCTARTDLAMSEVKLPYVFVSRRFVLLHQSLRTAANKSRSHSRLNKPTNTARAKASKFAATFSTSTQRCILAASSCNQITTYEQSWHQPRDLPPLERARRTRCDCCRTPRRRMPELLPPSSQLKLAARSKKREHALPRSLAPLSRLPLSKQQNGIRRRKQYRHRCKS